MEEFTLFLQLPKYRQGFKFLHDTLYFCVRGFQICGFFLIFNFSLTFWKSLFIDFFSKTYFSIEIFRKFSTYFNHECLQFENAKFEINASGNSAKKLLYLLRALKEKLTPGLPAAKSKRFKPAAVTFMLLYQSLCGKITLNFGVILM